LIRIFQIDTPISITILACLESALLLAAFYTGLYASWVDVDFTASDLLANAPKALLFWAVIFSWMFVFGLYRKDSVTSGTIFIPRLIVAFVVSYAVLALLFYSFPILVIWRAIIVVAVPVAFIFIVILRRYLKDALNSDVLKRRIVVLGCGEQALRIRELQEKEFASFYCLGFIPIAGEEIKVPQDLQLLPENNFVAALQASGAEMLIIATENYTEFPTRDLVECRLNGIRILNYQSFYSKETGRVDLDFLRPGWFFVEQGFQTNTVHRGLKRTSDLIMSILIALGFMPFFILISLAIILEDRGPVIYRQRRIGLSGKPFEMLKFRSMRLDAEADGEPVWSNDNDLRVTKVGRIIRHLRFDELPQVWNILRGDMSFVGPRPERPQFVDQISKDHPYFLDRHAVKPGLTGWAQINFPYASSEADAAKKLEFDLYYVKYGNILMDFVITLQTARVVLWPGSVR
jgi:sugar transferase (PEP-CTERM system associated)